jgi:hypothetical protein
MRVEFEIADTSVEGGVRSVTSEFVKLANLGRYLQSARSRGYANVWTVTGDRHPVTGEKMTMRTREFVRASDIISARVVDAEGEAIAMPPKGPYGLYRVVEEDGTNLPVGTIIPVARDQQSLRRYVVTGCDPEGVEIARHWLDAEHAPAGSGPQLYDDEDANDEDNF